MANVHVRRSIKLRTLHLHYVCIWTPLDIECRFKDACKERIGIEGKHIVVNYMVTVQQVHQIVRIKQYPERFALCRAERMQCLKKCYYRIKYSGQVPFCILQRVLTSDESFKVCEPKQPMSVSFSILADRIMRGPWISTFVWPASGRGDHSIMLCQA